MINLHHSLGHRAPEVLVHVLLHSCLRSMFGGSGWCGLSQELQRLALSVLSALRLAEGIPMKEDYSGAYGRYNQTQVRMCILYIYII